MNKQVYVATVLSAAVCLGGGLALDSGLDTNRNDVLDPDEVTATELLECEGTPTLRALHASPDATAVNIWVNGAVALTNVDYAQGSGFVPVVEDNNVQVEAIIPGGNAVVIDADLPTRDYNTETTVIAVDDVAGPVRPLVITNDSDSPITDGYFSDNSVIATSFPLNVMQGDEALAIVSGFATPGMMPAIAPIPLAGNTRSVITETKLRITHASPGTGNVDLYLVAEGTDINTVDPTFADVPFGADTTQLSIATGDYDAYVTGTGSKTPAISLPGLAFTGGEVLDEIARDPATGETGPQAVLIDYSADIACPAP